MRTLSSQNAIDRDRSRREIRCYNQFSARDGNRKNDFGLFIMLQMLKLFKLLLATLGKLFYKDSGR